MRNYSDIGIPFKQIDLAEADKIFSILTRYHGRVEAIGKGIRKISSKRAGNIDLMSLSRFSFSKGKELDIITEAELEDTFNTKELKYNKTINLLYICELLDKFTIIGDVNREIFELTLELLKNFSTIKTTYPIRSFELKLMKISGYDPVIDRCLVCNQPLVEEIKRYQVINQVGFYCKNEKYSKGKEISDNELKLLKFLSKEEFNEVKKLMKDKTLEKSLRDLIQNWIEIITEKRLNSKTIIN